MIAVTARQDWFSQAERHEVVPGSTLLEIVKQCGVPQWLEEAGEVCINGHPIPRENWRLVRPKHGTRDHPVVVSISPPILQGGQQGGSKQILSIVATVALIAGAAFISSGALVPLLGAWAGTAIGANALGSPFGVPGNLALKLPALP